jgi:hypothetical protein
MVLPQNVSGDGIVKDRVSEQGCSAIITGSSFDALGLEQNLGDPKATTEHETTGPIRRAYDRST